VRIFSLHQSERAVKPGYKLARMPIGRFEK
jgi:hypothetical protein